MGLLRMWKIIRIYRELCKDPLWNWVCQVTEADMDYCDACGDIDLTDSGHFIKRRMLLHATNHLQQTSEAPPQSSGEPERIEQ